MSHLFSIIPGTFLSSYLDEHQHEVAPGAEEPQQILLPSWMKSTGKLYSAWNVKASTHMHHFNSLRTQLLNNSVFHILFKVLHCHLTASCFFTTGMINHMLSEPPCWYYGGRFCFKQRTSDSKEQPAVVSDSFPLFHPP